MRVGDCLLAINDAPLRDVIDVQIYGSEPEIALSFERAGRSRTCRVRRRYGEPLGLEFANVLFEGEPRVCRNACDFCFVAQMAPGLRAPLYVKDDDYRLSFLFGNYITLTNLDTADWDRIESQYLSPLYVSVHTTEPEVRVDLMRNPRAGAIVTQLQRLADIGIEIHTQAVLVPGRNDGDHLDRTISDLAALYPAVRDLTVVPVGLTRWHNPDLRVYSDAAASRILDRALDWQSRLRTELGVGFVYPSDEWYLRAGVPVPEAEAYDGLLPAMIENGVGMVRRFLDGQDRLIAALGSLGGRQTWVTGTLFAPVLEAAARELAVRSQVSVDVVPVVNRFFGETVTVAGLLTAEDIIETLRQRKLGDVVVIPDEVFRGPEGQTLDGMTAASLGTTLGRPVVLAGYDEGRWQIVPAG